MNKKIIIIILLALIILGIIFRKRLVLLYYKSFQIVSDNEISNAFKNLSSIFSKEIMQNAEKIFKLETNYYSSDGFKKTFGAGMESFSGAYPWGWTSMQSYWDSFNKYKPLGTVLLTENTTGKQVYYLSFKSFEAGLFAVCKILELRGNDAGAWKSLTDENIKSDYRNRLTNIQNSYA
jgi:hypothetical protein